VKSLEKIIGLYTSIRGSGISPKCRGRDLNPGPVFSMTKVLTSVSLWSASPSLTTIPLLRSLLIPTAIAVRVARPKPRG